MAFNPVGGKPPRGIANLAQAPVGSQPGAGGAPRMSFDSIMRGDDLRDAYTMRAQPGLAEGFEKRLQTGTMDELRKRAMTEGQSDRSRLMQQQLSEQAREQGQGQRASAWNQMAMRGGLSGGGRERLARSAMRGTQRGLQDIGLQSRIEDERQKQALLQAMPGMELAQAQSILGAQQHDVGRQERADLTNIQTRLGELGSKRGYDLAKYGEEMKKYAADKQFQAEMKAAEGKK